MAGGPAVASPLSIARRLRLDHGAIAALMVPPPSPEVVEPLLSVLGPHNAVEEASDGLYATCDELLAGEAATLLISLRDFPPVLLAPHQDSALVRKHIAETLALARQAAQSPA